MKSSGLQLLAAILLLTMLSFAGHDAFAGGYLWRYGADDLYRPQQAQARFPVGYELSSTGYIDSGISNGELQVEIEAALNSWNAVLTSATIYSYLGEVGIDDGGATGPVQSRVDGHNIITFTDPDLFFDEVTLAYCLLSFTASQLTITADNADFDGDGTADFPLGTYPAGTILDADIVFDGNKAFFVDGSSPLDVQGVMLHEAGHCAGLSHSSIRDATMFPLANPDVATARMVHPDDAAALAALYPFGLNFPFTHGRITGALTSGATGFPVVGAHVFAVDVVSGQAVAGAYTLNDGGFDLVVPVGSYYVRIEPLDGDPIGLDPERINDIIADTPDRWFPEEFYDLSESNADDPDDAEPITITSFGPTVNINMVTNIAEIAGRFLALETGSNYISYPVEAPVEFSAFDLLDALAADTGVRAIQRFEPQSGRFLLAQWRDGSAGGVDFALTRGEGYLLHSEAPANVGFEGDVTCPSMSLRAGFSLIGVPCAPPGYSAFDFLADIGEPALIESIRHYDTATGQWQSAYFDAGVASGVDFDIVDGVGFAVQMNFALENFVVNNAGAILPPALYYASPGQGVAGAVVTLSGAGLASGTLATEVAFAGVSAQVIEASPFSITTRIPPGAVSGDITVTVAGLDSNPIYFEVLDASLDAVEGEVTDLISGQTVSASIDDVGDIDEFSFVAIKGNLLTAEAVAATPSNPRLVMKLYGPLGGVIRREESGALGQARILNMTIPETGYYRITIESADGLATGQYSLSLQLIGQASTPALHILGGDSQTAVAGTQLPLPIEVIASGAQGTPAAGIDVTVVVEDAPARANGAVRTPQSFTQSTNPQGILSLIVNTPSTDGFVYAILINAPGLDPVTMQVSVIDRPIAAMEITGDGQTCTGGCPVGQTLPENYEIVYKDGDDVGVSGVLTQWAVIAGEGTIDPASGGQSLTANQVKSTSGSDGRVAVSHTLGEALYFEFDETQIDAALITVPQQVAATVPGQAAPVVFSAMPKAGEPSQISWAGASHAVIPLGTVLLNAVKLRAADQYGNPVAGVPITVLVRPGLVAFPGLWSGGEFTLSETDARGFYVSALGAEAGEIEPTSDEFGNTNTLGLGNTYGISLIIPSAGASDVFTLDIPMGPVVTTSGQGAHALIGQPVTETMLTSIFRYQRLDSYIDLNADFLDDDGGDWSDPMEMDFKMIRRVVVAGVPMIINSRRDDGRDLAALGLPATTIDGQPEIMVDSDMFGEIALNNVQLGAVAGGISVINQTAGPIQVEFFRDSFLSGQTGASLGVLPFEPNTNSLKLIADPVTINIPLADKFPASGVSLGSLDPYPGIGDVSGIDLNRLGVSLNGTDILFGYSTAYAEGDPQLLGTFPNYRRFVADGKELRKLDDAVKSFRPATVFFSYQPTSVELQPTNTVSVSTFYDVVDNEFADEDPPVLPVLFPYPEEP